MRKGVYALRALAGNVGPVPHNTPKSSRPPRYDYRDTYREGSAGSDLGSRASFRDDEIARAEYEVDAARQAVGDLMRQIEQVCLGVPPVSCLFLFPVLLPLCSMPLDLYVTSDLHATASQLNKTAPNWYDNQHWLAVARCMQQALRIFSQACFGIVCVTCVDQYHLGIAEQNDSPAKGKQLTLNSDLRHRRHLGGVLLSCMHLLCSSHSSPLDGTSLYIWTMSHLIAHCFISLNILPELSVPVVLYVMAARYSPSAIASHRGAVLHCMTVLVLLSGQLWLILV